MNSEASRPEKYKRVEEISRAAGWVQDLPHGNRVAVAGQLGKVVANVVIKAKESLCSAASTMLVAVLET